MKEKSGPHRFFLLMMIALTLFYPLRPVLAHCDTLGGPVVGAARMALESGNVNRVLIWVRKKDEDEIKKQFQKTLAVRKLGPEAKELADMYFFETLVRIHRAGEGAPYTGLKPSETDLGPVIPCADKSIETGKVGVLIKLITDAVKEGVQAHLNAVMAKKRFNVDDVEAGREYVEAYVSYTHYVERLFETAKGSEEAGHAERHPDE